MPPGLANVPCEETFSAALYPQLLSCDALKRRINAVFAGHLSRDLRRCRKRPLALAIDLTLIASYGKHPLDDPHVSRGQAQRGTNTVFAYATAYLILQGQRFTLAVTPVTRSRSRRCCGSGSRR